MTELGDRREIDLLMGEFPPELLSPLKEISSLPGSPPPDLVRQVEANLALIPSAKRRPLERYFGYLSEASITEEITAAAERKGFTSVVDYEEALRLSNVGQTPRSLAIAELVGNSKQR